MKQLIRDLWYGNLAPFENCEEGKEDLKKLVYLIARNEEGLNSVLQESQKELFEKYKDCVEEYNSKLQENAFYEGLSLGIKIMTLALSDNQ